MNRKFSLTQAALADLDKLFAYGLENFGEAVATQHLRDIKSKFLLLSQFPELGQRREELFYLVANIRSFAVAPDVIYYRPDDDSVTIVRVVRGEQDIDATLMAWLKSN